MLSRYCPAGKAEAGDKGRGFPVAERDTGAQPLAPGRPAMPPRHVGRGPCLVDEDETLRIKVRLAIEPVLTPLQDIRPVLLGSMRRLFLRVMPRRLKKRQSVPMPAPMRFSARRA